MATNLSSEDRARLAVDPLHALVCNAFGYDKSIVRALALWARSQAGPNQYIRDLVERVLEIESLARSRSLCAVVHPMPDLNHPFRDSDSDCIEDTCTHSWRVEGERTYCGQPRSAHKG